MKYLILRKAPADEDPFLEMVSAGAGPDRVGLPQPETQDLDDRSVADLQADPTVEDVVLSIPFTLIEPVSVLSSPESGTAWGIEAVGASTSPQNGEGVAVAILDTGIESDHPAFSGVQMELTDFTQDVRGVSGSAPDKKGHGTHCAGTVCGREVDGTRIGVAPGIKRALIGKVLGPPNGGNTEALFNAINWALAQRADIISMSLGMDLGKFVNVLMKDYEFPADIAASRALEGYRSNLRLFDRIASTLGALVAVGRGAIIVAAAGNESRRDEDPRFTVGAVPPGAADGFTSVGAVSRTGQPDSPFAVAPFSNTGCGLAAPGVSIVSAGLGGTLVESSGTSMAAPHVAGVAALWTQRLFPESRPPDWARDVRRAVESHVLDTPYLARRDVGLGIVRAPQ